MGTEVFSSDKKNLIKKEYAHLDVLYFNSAYFGPSPYRAKQKVSNALFRELDPSFFQYNTWMGIADRVREQIALLLNCSSDQICHQTSSSDLISLIAQGFKFEKDDCVVSLDGDYPSNILPWMLIEKNRGIPFHKVTVKDAHDQNELEKLIPPNTKILNVSHVAFNTGRKIDISTLASFCKRREIFFILDTTQSFGGMEIKAEELAMIDVMVCSSYKWMLGPYGHAFGYFSKDAIKKIDCMTASWTKSPNSKVVHSLLDYTIATLPGARKFDRGQVSNMLTNACLEASLEFLSEVGISQIEKHNALLRDYFLANYPKDKFELTTPENRGNILTLKGKGIDPLQLETELKHRNIDVSVREGNLRFSFHVFNTQEQIDTVLTSLDMV